MNVSAENEDLITFKSILDDLNNLHHPSGPVYKSIQKQRALVALRENEIEAIYHLAESHASNFRNKAAVCYEKSVLKDKNANAFPLNKNYFNFKCSSTDLGKNIEDMIMNVREMPKEWTLIQLTSQYSLEENLNNDPEKRFSNPIHISVFNCGKDQPKPFCITVDSPRSSLTDEVIEVCQEMHSIIKDHKSTLQGILELNKGGYYKSYKDKLQYNKHREQMNARVKNVVKEIGKNWLREWRCLLIGKLVDDTVEKDILTHVEEFFKQKYPNVTISDRNKSLIKQLVKGVSYLTPKEINNAVKYMFQNEPFFNGQFQNDVICTIMKDDVYILGRLKRQPVILIVDEKLDFLPWEMIDVLLDHPVSRMPSLHFTYALFKEHESSIVDGIKVGINPNRGTYIINPGLDLKRMEARLKLFMDYWKPDWNGIVGREPTEEEFSKCLTTSDIFCYSGHGNGTQFFSGDKIENLKINAVVLLFGCGSTALTYTGPQVEMMGSHHMYLTASSPCVLGMLWDVTDVDTDIITTEFLSRWLPSKAPIHWKYISAKMWEKGEGLTFQEKSNSPRPLSTKPYVEVEFEEEVLRAIWRAKRAAKQYVTQAACIVRGLPTKIDLTCKS